MKKLDTAETINLLDSITNASVEIEAAQNILSMFIGRFFEDDNKEDSLIDLSIHWNKACNILLHVSSVLNNQVNAIDQALETANELYTENKLTA